MPRTLLCLVAVAALAVPCRADQPPSTTETLVRLTVSPAPAPRPALRYLLLPELLEMNPGNPIQNYMKCFMDQQKFFFDKEAFERREKLLTMPLKELPAQELSEYGGFALKQADWAARLDTPDWEILLKLKTDGVGLLLPDVQQIRMLATALKVRFRAEVSQRRFGDAIGTAKTMFAMARHMSLHPTLVGNLVGISIAVTATGPLEEMLEQPGCPNLFWALSNLPVPLVPVAKGIEGERALVLAEFHGLDDTAPMSADQLKKFIAHMDRLLGVPGKPVSIRAWLDARTKDDTMVKAARGRLGEHGLSEQRLLSFPADQILLLDEKREYEWRRDDIMKIMSLPVWQAEPMSHHVTTANKPPALFADVLLPGVYSTHLAQARLDQRIALLRHVEALRLFAAEHHGTPPAKLSDIALPLPHDPFNDKPFHYDVSGNTATVRGAPLQDTEFNAAYELRYELTFQK